MNRKEANNWKTIRKQTTYENPWICAEHRDVITPAGNPGIYGVVRFKNKAIGIVPVDDEGSVYLVGQYRYPLDTYPWAIPEGGVPIGDSPVASTQREAYAATGSTALPRRQSRRVHTSNQVTDAEGCIFLAQALPRVQAQPDETEELTLKRVPLAEAVDMVMRSE